MKKLLPITLGLALLPALSQAADSADGAHLHQENCVACHTNMTGGDGSTLYTRKDRRVSSLNGLETQVRRCESNLGLRWFDDEMLAVVNYLNDTYYHFDAKP